MIKAAITIIVLISIIIVLTSILLAGKLDNDK